MSIKLKKGINPKGTTHDLVHYLGKERIKLRYKVTELLGVRGNMPSDGAVIYLIYAGGPIPGCTPSQFYSAPLDVFIREAIPAEKEDFFWEQELDVI
jgi:hypothetical protein